MTADGRRLANPGRSQLAPKRTLVVAGVRPVSVILPGKTAERRAAAVQWRMPPRYYRIRVPSNPIMQALLLIGTAMLAVGAVFIGAIVLSLFLGLAVIAGLVFYIRLWWLQRQAAQAVASESPGSQEYVEGECTVVQEHSASDDRTRDPTN